MRFEITKGLDVPLPGLPERARVPGVDEASVERKPVSSVALLGADYIGLSFAVLVRPGDRVRLGQPVVRDLARSRVQLTAPGAGVVREVQRGAGRSLATLVIELDEPGAPAIESGRRPGVGREAAVEALLSSGLWTALRERPFGGVPDPATSPRAIFVTAMESDPLAPRAESVLAASADDFAHGVHTLTALTDGLVHVCTAPNAAHGNSGSARVQWHEFAGPHPAGLVGTHMHLVDPVGRGRTAWHLAYPDVIAIGRLFRTGELSMERSVALAGPRVARPRLLRTRLGASIDDLVAGELLPGRCRVVSGSPLSGRQATSWGRHLGRHHRQVCVLAEPAAPDAGPSRGSLLDALRRRLPRAPAAEPTTALHGRPGALMPTPVFERVLPFDVPPAPLLRALLVGDVETAEALGCLELDEEDLALCTYVCPAKLEYGGLLRAAFERLLESG